MRLKRFRPRVLPTVLLVLLLPLFIRLGFWQLQRADEKHMLEALLVERGQLPSLHLERPPIDLDDLQYRPVYVQGYYDTEHSILLDNRVQDGRVGYHVLTPLRSSNTEFAVLVNRGWVAAGRQRSDLPEVETPASMVTVHGMIVGAEARSPFAMSEHNREGEGWPAVVQWVDTESLSTELGYNLQGVIVRLDADAPHGHIRDWHRLDLQPGKNVGYAIQWFSFAAVLLILYLVLNFRRVKASADAQKNE